LVVRKFNERTLCSRMLIGRRRPQEFTFLVVAGIEFILSNSRHDEFFLVENDLVIPPAGRIQADCDAALIKLHTKQLLG